MTRIDMLDLIMNVENLQLHNGSKQVAAEPSQAQPTLSGLSCNFEVVTIVTVKESCKK